MRQVSLRAFLLALSVLCAPLAAWANPTVLTVKVAGTVEWRPNTDARWNTLTEKTVLEKGAMVRTAEISNATIIIGRTVLVDVGPMSEFAVTDLAGDNQEAKAALALLSGRVWLRYNVGRTTNLIFRSSTARAEFTGGSFFVQAEERRQTVLGSWVGDINASGVRGTVQVPASQQTVVETGKAPKPAHNMPPEQRELLANFDALIRGAGLERLFPATVAVPVEAPVAPPADDPASMRQRAAIAVARDDLEKLKTVLAFLYRDTNYYPGRGANAISGQTALTVLTVNKDSDGRQLPGWKGPYVGSELLDPFGTHYSIYLNPNDANELIIASLGPDKTPSDDDIKSVLTLDDLRRRSQEAAKPQ